MVDEAMVTAAWAEERFNEVTQDGNELRDRLSTILRSARAAGIELGDDLDFDLCVFFREHANLKSDAAFIDGLLDAVPIIRAFPPTKRVSVLVKSYEQYKAANHKFVEEQDVARRTHLWCDHQLLGRDDDGVLKLLCCAHLHESRCFVCPQTEERCKEDRRTGNLVGRCCDYECTRLTREKRLEEELAQAKEKADAWQTRAMDAERRATQAVGRTRRIGVGFGNVNGGT